jgi:hypothetical protein
MSTISSLTLAMLPTLLPLLFLHPCTFLPSPVTGISSLSPFFYIFSFLTFMLFSNLQSQLSDAAAALAATIKDLLKAGAGMMPGVVECQEVLFLFNILSLSPSPLPLLISPWLNISFLRQAKLHKKHLPNSQVLPWLLLSVLSVSLLSFFLFFSFFSVSLCLLCVSVSSLCLCVFSVSMCLL